jgi:hypothetical protein
MKHGAISVSDLNTDDLKAYYEISAKIAEGAPDLVSYYDDQGRAIIDLTKDIKDLKEAQSSQIREAAQLRVDNKENFAKEYTSTIDEAQKTIGEKRRLVGILGKGQDFTDMYNMTHNTNYDKDDITKFSAEVETQQQKIKEASDNIKKNIVDALFSSSKSYANLNKDQQDMVRALFDVEKATELAYNPQVLENYEKGVTTVMDVLGKAGDAEQKIEKNNDQIQRIKEKNGKGSSEAIAKLEEQNKTLKIRHQLLMI